MSKRSRRNRGAYKAALPAVRTTGVSYSTDQVVAMMTAQQQALASGNTRAVPLETSPYWEMAPFGPGRRLPPAPINVPREDTGRAEPRLWQYPVSWNLQIDDRWHVPWATLQRAGDMPLFRKCIKRRKGVCSLGFTVGLDPKAVAREAATSGQADKDVEKAMRAKYMPEIIRCSDWLENPDDPNGYDWAKWAGLLMENRLKYDAAVVYPRFTYGGQLSGLEVIDGKTIKPLLNEYGGRPAPPYPAYQQIMYGFPRGEFTADYDPADTDAAGKPVIPGGFDSDVLIYERTEVRSESPYGMSDTEIALLDGLIWMRRIGWIMAEYTEGVTPGGLLETEPNDWTPRQWEEFQRGLNDHLGGNTAERHKWPMLPPGVKMVQIPEVAERYKPDYDMFLLKLIAGDFGLTATEIGFPEVGSLGASFHEGEEDVLNRVTRIPDSEWLAGMATKLSRRFLGMPPVLQVQILGLESEDEAAADAVAQNQVATGRLTLNQDRERRGEPPYDFAEADMPMIQVGRGVVFLEGASQTAPPGTLIEPATAPPTSVPPGAADESGDGEEQDGQGEESGPGARAAAAPASKAAELAALRNWLGKARNAGRTFRCDTLTAADAPQFAGNPRVVFKADDAGPKARSVTGRAGYGILIS